jgi:protein TonB
LACKQNTAAGKNDPQTDDQKETLKEETTNPGEEITYNQVPHMPRFPGCEDIEHPLERTLCAQKRLNNYIHNRLEYPRQALLNQIEGTVVVEFVVRPDGLLDEIGIRNDIGFGCGETLLKIFASMNRMNERWIPGRKDGKPVRVRMSMPIEFRLMDYQKEEG